MAVVELTDTTFDEVVHDGDVPVLVEFTAPWCGHCARFAPVLEAVAAEHEGKLVVASIDSEDNLRVSQRYDVMGLPTVLVFVDGQVRRRFVGARGKQQLLGELAEYL